jgi:hypothetical protein
MVLGWGFGFGCGEGEEGEASVEEEGGKGRERKREEREKEREREEKDVPAGSPILDSRPPEPWFDSFSSAPCASVGMCSVCLSFDILLFSCLVSRVFQYSRLDEYSGRESRSFSLYRCYCYCR